MTLFAADVRYRGVAALGVAVAVVELEGKGSSYSSSASSTWDNNRISEELFGRRRIGRFPMPIGHR